MTTGSHRDALTAFVRSFVQPAEQAGWVAGIEGLLADPPSAVGWRVGPFGTASRTWAMSAFDVDDARVTWIRNGWDTEPQLSMGLLRAAAPVAVDAEERVVWFRPDFEVEGVFETTFAAAVEDWLRRPILDTIVIVRGGLCALALDHHAGARWCGGQGPKTAVP